MIGENGTPETPDWSPCAGNACGSCQGSANLCKCSRALDETPCCGQCQHQVTAGSRDITYPVAYYGD